MKIALFLLPVVFCSGILAMSPQDEFRLVYSGSTLWNNITDIDFAPPYAYCSAPYGLMVLDINDSNDPVEIARLAFMDGQGNGIALSRQWAFLADIGGGLKIIDVSDPFNPVQAGEYMALSNVADVAADSDYVYAIDNHEGLTILQIDDSGIPSAISSTVVPGYPERIALKYPYVYIASDGGSIVPVDISDPSSPLVLDSGLSIMIDIALSDTLACTATYSTNLQIYSLANPAKLLFLEKYYVFDYIVSADIKGRYAYAVYRDSGLYVLDISRLPAIFQAAHLDLSSTPNRVRVWGDYAYIPTLYSDMQIVHITYPPQIFKAGSFGSIAVPFGCDIVGDYAFVADAREGLQVIDVSTPDSPQPVSRLALSGGAGRIEIDGILAYMSSGNCLHIVNIFDPAHPVLIGSYDTTGIGRDIDYESGHVYLANSSAGLIIIDVTHPANPIMEGSCKPSRSDAYGVAVSGNYAYVADRDASLWIADISDHAHPIIVSSLFIPHETWDIQLRGDYAYIANGLSGLVVVDISDPLTPFIVDSVSTGGGAYCIDLSGQYAYVSDPGNVAVVDISNPDSLWLVHRITTPGEARGVTVDGNRLYVSDWIGFSIWQIDMPLDITTSPEGPLPQTFELYQNHPNPFNPSTVISYQLVRDENVRLEIYNVLGQPVVQLIDGRQRAGNHQIVWDGKDNAGIEAPSGIYIYRMQAGGSQQCRMMTLIR